MSTDLDVSGHHEKAVLEYLKFTRVRRNQCVRTVVSTFEETIDSRLNEGTFTAEEVKEMMSGLESVVRSDVECELLHIDHSSVLLLKQLCVQADKWHLKLQPDISELQNREMLEEIARVEAQVFSEPLKASKPTRNIVLEPLQDVQGTELLRKQLAELQKENDRLQGKLRGTEQAAIVAIKDKEVSAAKQKAAVVTNQSQDTEISKLKQQISELQLQLENSLSNKGGVANQVGGAADEEKLLTTTHELLRVTSELDHTKQELEKKFGDTAQYNNLRAMLSSKNSQIKELREKLKKYEPDS